MLLNTEDFQPTYLYIKQHPVTGLLYLGKTTGSEQYLLESYLGSGDYWEDHLRIHGNENIETLWYCLFTERDEIVKFALMISEQMDIVKSKNANGKKIWANLMHENGLDGAPKGRKTKEKTKEKLRGQSRAKIAATGKIIPGKVSTSDPRWLTGEIVHPSNGEKKSDDYKLKRKGFKQTDSGRGNISKAQTGSGNSQYGTTYMINHTTKEKTRLSNLRVNELIPLGWVLGNKHSYTFINSKILLPYSS